MIEEIYSSSLDQAKIIPGSEYILNIDDRNKEVLLSNKISNYRWFKFDRYLSIKGFPSFHVRVITQDDWNRDLCKCETLEDFFIYCTRNRITLNEISYLGYVDQFNSWEMSYTHFKRLFEQNNNCFYLALVAYDMEHKIIRRVEDNKHLVVHLNEILKDWLVEFVNDQAGISICKFTYGKLNKLLEKI